MSTSCRIDIKQVENTVEGISEYDVNKLPNFMRGEAIFTGVGMEIPARVIIKK